MLICNPHTNLDSRKRYIRLLINDSETQRSDENWRQLWNKYIYVYIYIYIYRERERERENSDESLSDIIVLRVRASAYSYSKYSSKVNKFSITQVINESSSTPSIERTPSFMFPVRRLFDCRPSFHFERKSFKNRCGNDGAPVEGGILVHLHEYIPPVSYIVLYGSHRTFIIHTQLGNIRIYPDTDRHGVRRILTLDWRATFCVRLSPHVSATSASNGTQLVRINPSYDHTHTSSSDGPCTQSQDVITTDCTGDWRVYGRPAASERRPRSNDTYDRRHLMTIYGQQTSQ